MRTKIFVFLIFGLAILKNSYAHKYITMLVEGNSWNVLHHGDDFNLTQVLKVSTDTVINDTVYSKIISAYDSLSANWSLAGYMREDILAQKVYFRPLGLNAKEMINYSFNVKVGNKIMISIVDYFIRSSTDSSANQYIFNYYIVNLIDSVNIDGIYHKRVFADYYQDIELYPDTEKGMSILNAPHVWIEGIGDIGEGLLRVLLHRISYSLPNCFVFSTMVH